MSTENPHPDPRVVAGQVLPNRAGDLAVAQATAVHRAWEEGRASINLEDLLEAARRVVSEWDHEFQDGYEITPGMNDALESLADVVGHTMRVDR